MERRQPATKQDSGGLYFSRPAASLRFIRSGSTLLDLVVSGGWPLGRMSNVIGDNSSGKTLIAIEAMANFAEQFPKGKIWYRETEAAFDQDYAGALGLPLDRVDFGEDGQWNTVEDIFDDLTKRVAWHKANNQPGLYIVDSLDALSDRAELEREIDEGSYSMTKQKQLHRLFREQVRDIKKADIHLMIVSQTRQKIGVSFGEKTTRSGGASLDFYASQHLRLAKLGQLTRTIRGQKQTVGMRIRAKCTKNKIGLPHCECDFDLRFGFGVNDASACLEFLMKMEMTKYAENLTLDAAKKLKEYLDKLDKPAHDEWGDVIREATKKAWPMVQSEKLPKWSKY